MGLTDDQRKTRHLARMREAGRIQFDGNVLDRAEDIQRGCVDGCPLAAAHALLPLDTLKKVITGCSLPGAKDEFGAPALAVPQRELEAALHVATLEALAAGELRATGYDERGAISAPAVDIPADRWGALAVDWSASSARHSSGVLSGIVVYATPKQRGRRPAQRPPDAAVDSAYMAHLAECAQAGRRSSEANDVAAMKKRLGDGVTRAATLDARKRLAPQEWEIGRRGRPIKSAGKSPTK